jgi:predicted ArsR family transcriptional regulator
VSDLSDAKRRIVERLQRVDAATAGELATEFELTDTAIRQHLESLQESGFVHRIEGAPVGRGRPAARWQLSDAASVLFPDRHVDLSLELIESVRSLLGDEVLGQVIASRAQRQLDQYRRNVGTGTTAVRVRRLAAQRTAEGYAAEVTSDGDDLLLTEHHCPVRAAAGACGELCSSELEVFRSTLGEGLHVTREQHLLAGDHRCAYRIAAA